MSVNDYLKNVLKEQEVLNGNIIHNKLKSCREEIEGKLKKIYGSKVKFYYGGSYGKKTMILLSYDLDIVIYFPPDENRTLKEIYNDVYSTLYDFDYNVHKKTVAIRIYKEDNFHIDVVPGRAQDFYYHYATLYKNGKDTTMQTSLKEHIDSVRDVRDIVKLMKLWRLRHSVPIETFPLEQLVVKALYQKRKDDYEYCIMTVLTFLRDRIIDIRVEDPANTNNIIEITPNDRFRILFIATNCLRAHSWCQIIY